MICRYCGTALPGGALFCGECGRAVHLDKETTPAAAVSTTAPPPGLSDELSLTADPVAIHVSSAVGRSTGGVSIADLSAAGVSIADLAFSSPGETSLAGDADDRELPDGTPIDGASGSAHCPQCGEAMEQGDVFCGECGFVVRTVEPPTAAADATTEVEPPTAAADATTEVEPLSDHFEEIGGPPAATSGASEPDDAPPFVVPLGQPTPSPRSRPIPDPFPWGSDRPVPEDLEATRIVADSASGARYVLQFSTGESVTVAGSGLVGRNPSMQPGEYVDQLVPIFDAGKSVSKTHLEFGQEGGRFWVSDRYSTNGSFIRQPDAEPRRCDPGRRYFIARGSRVDIGEQFFVVS